MAQYISPRAPFVHSQDFGRQETLNYSEKDALRNFKLKKRMFLKNIQHSLQNKFSKNQD